MRISRCAPQTGSGEHPVTLLRVGRLLEILDLVGDCCEFTHEDGVAPLLIHLVNLAPAATAKLPPRLLTARCLRPVGCRCGVQAARCEVRR